MAAEAAPAAASATGTGAGMGQQGAAVAAFAPAKINLCLHVTGRRADGYHLLDSLVVFADVGDRLTAAPAPSLTLEVTGPRAAGVPNDGSNLVLRAAALLGSGGAALRLEKHLPTASGIGGGSSDAAAALRALCRLWGRPLPELAVLATLGADLPVCLAARPMRMAGIGEDLSPAPPLPGVHLLLVNPGAALSTPAVFRALDRRDNAPMPAVLPHWRDAAELAAWLSGMRNDLEAPALTLAPPVAAVLTALRGTQECLLARMSGSGATCFGLYATAAAALRAAQAIGRAQPGWWVAPAGLWQDG